MKKQTAGNKKPSAQLRKSFTSLRAFSKLLESSD
jgi:hypothetical protein